MQLKNKVVFITGGASGIGAACATKLAENGAKIVLGDIDEDNGHRLAVELNNKFGGDRFIFTKCDVTDEGQFKSAFKTAIQTFNRVDIMVNNAGILDETNWKRTLDINLKGTITGTEIALSHMRTDRGGHGGIIINVASVCDFRPVCFLPVYVASKQAVIGYTRSMATAPDVKQLGVRYACLCPEPVDTPLFHNCKPSSFRGGYNEYRQKLLLQKKLSPDAVAEGLLSLVADDDSTNGTLLHISLDGLAKKIITVETI